MTGRLSIATLALSLTLISGLGTTARAEVCSPSALSGASAEAAGVVDRFHGALKAGDLAGAKALLATDLLVFEAGGREVSLEDYSREHLPADMAYEAGAKDTLLSRCGASDGTFAWIATLGHVQVPLPDRTVERQTTETVILRHTDRGWVIAHVHWSSQAAKALD